VPTAVACDLLLVVWKLRRSRVEAGEGAKAEVEVRARRERVRVVDIVVVGGLW